MSDRPIHPQPHKFNKKLEVICILWEGLPVKRTPHQGRPFGRPLPVSLTLKLFAIRSEKMLLHKAFDETKQNTRLRCRTLEDRVFHLS